MTYMVARTGLEAAALREEVRILAWCARQLAQANGTQPIPGKDAVGPFLEVRAGGFTAGRAKETLVFKGGSRRNYQIRFRRREGTTPH